MNPSMNNKKNLTIDAVITWVDGEDPIHQAKRAKFLTKKKENKFKDVAGATRYNQVGEIFYCIASILRFAPWINKIFIVTDDQDPKVNDFIRRHFPDNKIPIEIVDHKVIFEGYEEYLPTFNSLTITSMLWRIPHLSEHFILFNDDVILQKETTIEDFFIEGKSVLYGENWIPTFMAEATIAFQTFIRKLSGRKALLSFKKFMLNAAYITKEKKFIRLRHTPHPFQRSIFQNFYEKKPEFLIYNIKHRFRNKEQYSAAELHHLLATKQKKVILPLRKGKDVIVSPFKYNLEGIKKELKRIKETPNYLYFCANSLDQSSPEIIKEVISWMNEIIGLTKKE